MTQSKSGKKKKHWILIVDDENEIRRMIKERIEFLNDDHEEFKIVEASDGVDATNKIHNQKFDCIITDLNMPKRTGQQLIPIVKSHELNAKTPIIVVTAYPDHTLPENYQYLTMIEKPFRINDLLKIIREQIRLGPIDQRIPVQLFNLFLAGTENFLTDYLHVEPERLAPFAKSSGEDFKGRYVYCMKVLYGPLKSWIALSAEKYLLDSIAKVEGKTDVEVMEFLSKSVLQRMVNIKNPDIKLEIEESVLLTQKNIREYNLSNLQGITVPYKTQHGNLNCEALVGHFSLIKKTVTRI